MDTNTGVSIIMPAYNSERFIKEAIESVLNQTYSKKELLKQNLISCSSVLVDRELFLRHQMPEMQNIHEDFACWLSILIEEKYAYGIDEPLLIYINRMNTIMDLQLIFATVKILFVKDSTEGVKE